MPKNILFVCTGNTCRSAMAQALLTEMAQSDPHLRGKLNADSAGTRAFPGSPMTDTAIKALELLGVKAKAHRAKRISREIAAKADLILAMEQSHLEQIRASCPEFAPKAFTLKGYADGGANAGGERYDVKDPYGAPIEVYVECAKEIKQALESVMVRLESEV